MSLERFRDEDGYYADSSGITYETATGLIQCGLLGFCGCGDLEGSLRYIRDGLRHIIRQFDDDDSLERWATRREARAARGLELFGNEASQQFFYYWADKEGLTEHGTSIPGWLTEKGKQLLADLEEVLQSSDNP